MGHTRTQGASAQWLHCLGTFARAMRPSGRSTSKLSIQVLNAPRGTSFSRLQATVHALQPMHRDRSISMPSFLSLMIAYPLHAFSILNMPPQRPGEAASFSAMMLMTSSPVTPVTVGSSIWWMRTPAAMAGSPLVVWPSTSISWAP